MEYGTDGELLVLRGVKEEIISAPFHLSFRVGATDLKVGDPKARMRVKRRANKLGLAETVLNEVDRFNLQYRLSSVTGSGCSGRDDGLEDMLHALTRARRTCHRVLGSTESNNPFSSRCGGFR